MPAPPAPHNEVVRHEALDVVADPLPDHQGSSQKHRRDLSDLEKDLAPQNSKDPPHIKLKLFKTSSGWSTSPDSQDTMFGGPKATQPGVESQYGQASPHTMSPSVPLPVYPPTKYQHPKQ